MNWKLPLSISAVLLLGGAAAYYVVESGHDHSGAHADHDHGHGRAAGATDAPDRGPHGGRLLRDGNFALELALVERGGPPTFHAWFTRDGKPLAPAGVTLTVELKRPGGQIDRFSFTPAGDHARGSGEVAEPHSFDYTVVAEHGGRTSRWQFAAPELQTTLTAEVARRAGIVVAAAGPASLAETLPVYGQIKLNANKVARATPRFGGLVREARKALGDAVAAGEVVAVVETNQSLVAIEVTSPIAGVIVDRNVTVADGAALYTIADLSEVWADIAVPRRDQSRVRVGQPVELLADDGGPNLRGTIAWLSPLGAAETQSLTARVVLDNSSQRWRPGLFVKAAITLAEIEVPVTVRESGLQTLFDFTVVFTQHGDIYQARPLELGRRSGGLVEVTKGLAAGENYVVENSYLLKADIGKSGAAHDH
jgi:cobalt-zinc-cadmium efflux system membrane fusion protein